MPTSRRPNPSSHRRKRGPHPGRVSPWTVLLAVAVIAAASVAAAMIPPRLGLDLRGGTQITLQAIADEGQSIDDDTMDRTVEVLRRRIDTLGVTEPVLQRSGSERILVELPGVTDPDEAVAVIGRTARLTFHPVLDPTLGIPDYAVDEDGTPLVDDEGRVVTDPSEPLPAGVTVLLDEDGAPLALGEPALSGDGVRTAGVTLNQGGGPAGTMAVTVDFQGDGRAAWERLTGDAACQPAGSPLRRIAIVLDNTVLSSPQVDPSVTCGVGIIGGSTTITGNFSEDEANELSLLIRGGALPINVEVAEQRVVGPTLGEEAISSSLLAGAIGLLLTLLYMVAAYRVYGLLAGIGLALYGLLAYASLLAIGATLTLPGIAGFVLAIGMAIDANVLVFERTKEEHAAGSRTRRATDIGFKKALSAVVDSNVTTVIAAVVLLMFASGAVRGFGVTVSIGVAVSMFTALVLVRTMIALLLRSKRVETNPKLLGLTAWSGLRRWLERTDLDLMRRARLWTGISAVVIVVALSSFVVRPVLWGLEFTGGQLLQYQVSEEVDLTELSDRISDAGVGQAIVQIVDGDQVAVRTGQLDPETRTQVVEEIAAVGGEVTLVQEEFIGPTIGAELRRGAIIALGLALLAQLLYLAFRFRWTYGVAAVVAMVHDVVILLGAFVWLGKTFDGVFLAALLTVIGYSINDTVVTFDRVREQRSLDRKAPLAKVANDAILATFPRTLNTGMGALFILLALFLVGSATLADFALALLIGTTVGIYSSLLVASPLLVVTERYAARRAAKRG